MWSLCSTLPVSGAVILKDAIKEHLKRKSSRFDEATLKGIIVVAVPVLTYDVQLFIAHLCPLRPSQEEEIAAILEVALAEAAALTLLLLPTLSRLMSASMLVVEVKLPVKEKLSFSVKNSLVPTSAMFLMVLLPPPVMFLMTLVPLPPTICFKKSVMFIEMIQMNEYFKKFVMFTESISINITDFLKQMVGGSGTNLIRNIAGGGNNVIKNIAEGGTNDFFTLNDNFFSTGI